MIPDALYEPCDPLTALQVALMDQTWQRARILALAPPGGSRILARMLLLETLAACRVYAGDAFWRRCVALAQEEIG